MLPSAAFRGHLERDARALGDLLRSHDLATPVPTCPGWTLADLARHVGGTHRWAADILRSGAVVPEREPVGDPCDWYDAGWPGLLDAIDGADPAAECWSFGPRPRLAGFWTRRQAHETALHLWDARAALDQDCSVDEQLADDGIDEVLTVFFPREVSRGRCPSLEGAVALVHHGGRHVVGAGDPSVTLSGAPLPLLLLLWGRGGLDGLDVRGDLAAAQSFAALPMTP